MHFLPQRLNARIAFLVAGILLVTGLISAWYTASHQATVLLATMRVNSSAMAANFAGSIARHLLMTDYAELEDFLVKSVQLPDIDRLQVCEPDGALIWDVQRQPGGPPTARTGIAHLAPPATNAAAASMENGSLVIWQPVVAGNVLGWLRAEFSLDAIRAAQGQAWGNALLLVAVWVGSSVLLILAMLRPTLRSIGALTEFSKHLDDRKGEQITVPAVPREISELSISLNEASRQLLASERQLLDERERLRQSEEKYRRLNQELEHRVAERTVQLESANKELEAFSYSVSHDLRAPLRHIDGFIGMLREDLEAGLGDEDRHYMEVITRSARQMEALIDDLLAFSRIGRSELHKGPVDLGAMVAEIVQDVEPEVGDRHIEWNIGALPTATGDRALLHVAMSNLILNAVKFTRGRDPARIEIGCLAASGGEDVVFVRDNGAGFDMANADRLFGVFERLHRADEFEGTGIGLANVRRVISRHGGRTWAEGRVGEGATFYLSLPIAAKGSTDPNDPAGLQDMTS